MMTFNRIWMFAVFVGIVAGAAIGFYAAVASGVTEAPKGAVWSQAAVQDIAADVTGDPVLARATPDGVQAESIQVHGKWTLEVRDPDGTVVTSRVFQNSLTTAGQSLLSGILALNITSTAWQVDIFSPSGQELCQDSLSNPQICRLVGTGLATDTWIFETLALTGDASSSGTGTFVLSGSFTAATNGVIDQVKTRMIPS